MPYPHLDPPHTAMLLSFQTSFIISKQRFWICIHRDTRRWAGGGGGGRGRGGARTCAGCRCSGTSAEAPGARGSAAAAAAWSTSATAPAAAPCLHGDPPQ